MESVPISRFKATCLALIEQVRRTGQPLIVTKRGEPVVQVIPAPPSQGDGPTGFGCMADETEIVGDIVSPLPAEDWEVGDPVLG